MPTSVKDSTDSSRRQTFQNWNLLMLKIMELRIFGGPVQRYQHRRSPHGWTTFKLRVRPTGFPVILESATQLTTPQGDNRIGSAHGEPFASRNDTSEFSRSTSVTQTSSVSADPAPIRAYQKARDKMHVSNKSWPS